MSLYPPMMNCFVKSSRKCNKILQPLVPLQGMSNSLNTAVKGVLCECLEALSELASDGTHPVTAPGRHILSAAIPYLCALLASSGAWHAQLQTSAMQTLLLLLCPQEMNMAKTWRAFPDSSSKV